MIRLHRPIKVLFPFLQCVGHQSSNIIWLCAYEVSRTRTYSALETTGRPRIRAVAEDLGVRQDRSLYLQHVKFRPFDDDEDD